MKVTIELPESLLEEPQAAEREIVREVLLSAFNRGKISKHELREKLGIDRWSLDILLTQRKMIPAFSLDDAEADAATLTRVLS